MLNTVGRSSIPVFEENLKSGKMQIVVGVWDALSALIVESAGFDGLMIGSFATTSALNGLLDLGLRTPYEQVELVRTLRGITKLPIFVDGESGWGEAFHAAHWVKEFERAGADGIMFEDSGSSLSNWNIPGSVEVVEPVEKAAARFKAAADAKTSRSFKIIARSRAKVVPGLDEQVSRLTAYQKAGADILWASSGDPETLKSYRKKLKGPLLATVNTSRPDWEKAGGQATMNVEEFRRCGIQILCYENILFLIYAKASMDAAIELRGKGSIISLRDKIMDAKKLARFLGYEDMPEFLEKYNLGNPKS